MKITILLIIKGLFIMESNIGLINLLNSPSAQEERRILGITKEQQASSLMDMAVHSTRNGKDYVVSAVKKRFANPAMQAAILGSIEHETGGSFDSSQKQSGGGA